MGTLYREEITDLEARRTDLELRNLEANIEHRKQYAGRIFSFVTAWMTVVFGVLLVDGWSARGFDLSDKALITLIGGNSLSVPGLFAIVTDYFFPKAPKPPGKRRDSREDLAAACACPNPSTDATTTRPQRTGRIKPTI